jgi:myo-inositol-1(or 4)-monophosphatase
VVYDPMGEELFTAERGSGARLNGRPIRVSSCDALGDAMLCTGFPYAIRERPGAQVEVFGAFLGRAQAVRRLGSAALDLCYVAAGRLDGFWELQLHPWDIAAGGLILEEAGGRITAYDGGPVDLFRGQVVASNGRLHGAISEVIASHHR